MTTIFLKLLNMSITAGWLILAVMALRVLLRKAPKWLCCLLWALAAVRLLCPFSLESVFSVIPSREPIQHSTAAHDVISIDSGIRLVDNMVNPILQESLAPKAGPAADTIAKTAEPLELLLFIADILWAAGAAAMLLYAAVSCLRLYSNIRTAVRFRDNIYISEFVDTPFIFGMIRPRIYLPTGMSEELRSPVIAHEQAHLKRGDYFWKALGYILLSIYWFHPLCWAAYSLFCKDIELACDEKVIRDYSPHEKRVYSEALLACSINRRAIAISPLAFGEIAVKERIKSVIHYKKPAFWAVLAAAVICIAAAVCFMTDPVEAGNAKDNFSSANAGGSDDNGILYRLSQVDWAEIKRRNLSRPEYPDWSDIICIDKIPGKDIAIYGYNDADYSQRGIAVDMDGTMHYFDWCYSSPRGVLPDCYWDEGKQQLTMALYVYTGTGADAQELHVLQYSPDGSLQDNIFDFNDYSSLLSERISFTHDEATGILTLYDNTAKKELAQINIAKEKVDYIELGSISQFLPGEKLTLRVEMGYCPEGMVMPEYDANITLDAEVLMEKKGNGIEFSFGEIINSSAQSRELN